MMPVASLHKDICKQGGGVGAGESMLYLLSFNHSQTWLAHFANWDAIAVAAAYLTFVYSVGQRHSDGVWSIDSSDDMALSSQLFFILHGW